jgi:hypothetical protein
MHNGFVPVVVQAKALAVPLVLQCPFDHRVNCTLWAATKTDLQAVFAEPRYVSANGEGFLGCSGF